MNPLLMMRGWARLRSSKPALVVSPGFAPIPYSVPWLLTVHDLIHLNYPPEASIDRRAFYHAFVRPAIKKLGLVVTVSEFSKREIQEWAGPDIDVVVVPNGLSFDPSVDIPEREPGRLLFVGNDKPHKRLVTAVRALTLDPDLTLITVGCTDKEVQKRRLQYGVASERIKVLNNIGDKDLLSEYRRAHALVFPSEYEGFGLPAIEAMSQGTPVIHYCEAVAEVVAEPDSRLDDPADGAQVVDILRSIDLTEERQQARIARAASFSWERSAAKFMSAIHAALERL